MKISHLVAISVLAAGSVPAVALAQDATAAELTAPAAEAAAPAAGSATLAAGQAIFGPQGEEVAKVVSVEGENVVITTGANQATLPASALGTSEKGPTIAYNKDQLNAAIDAANKQANAGAAGSGATQPEGGQ
ncbi:hypothetical protein [Caenibius tardaugens]|nr:hypothetical protein [Caenibius tardaugens]AZI34626.1 hypothetical protein EGO55_00600 [Caenibius tardaugens NBRC 16725]